MDTRTQVNKTYSLTIREYYLDYVNNFLSLEYFASHHCLTLEHARQLIKIGREMHETHCESLRPEPECCAANCNDPFCHLTH